MDVKEFRKELIEEVKASAVTNGEGSNSAFVDVMTEYLINSEVLSDFTKSFYIARIGSKKLRVDGYVYDEIDNTFTLVIADYIGKEDREVVTRTYAIQQFDFLYHFLEESYGNKLHRDIEPSTPAADLVEWLRIKKSVISKFRFILLTDGFISERISEINYKDYSNIAIECQIWDISRVFRVCVSDSGREDVQIDFKAYTNGKGIPCLEASDVNNNEYKSYLCIIPGRVLADIYDKYGSQLLEGNVRSFLSTKVAVNKKIRETILRYPNRFFAYNNGISATAVDLKTEKSGDGLFITFAKDFQIINGGQTTASLSNARHKDRNSLESIYIQMKLTEIDSDTERTNELIRDISKSSNSQNKVSDADFFSTHPFHVRIEQLSRRIYAPASEGAQYETKWFYERARGQYLQRQMKMTKAEKDRFVLQNPKKQVVTKTDLAKYRNTWDGFPHTVSKGAQTNFMSFAETIEDRWNNDNSVFNDNYYKETIALAILFKHTEWVVSNQPWFEKGYRANIVTYSIALLHKLIINQFKDYDLDLRSIWNKQRVPDAITAELVKITKVVFDCITDRSRLNMNVTQWCKREECWNTVKKCNLTLSNSIDRYLISKEEINRGKKGAKKDQRFISDIEAQTLVLNLGSSFWSRVNDFVLINRLQFSPKTQVAMKYALQIPRQFPSTYQSKLLLDLLEKARENGFKE